MALLYFKNFVSQTYQTLRANEHLQAALHNTFFRKYKLPKTTRLLAFKRKNSLE